MEPKLIQLYQELSEHTAPLCAGSSCKVPHSCCEQIYCEMAEAWSEEKELPVPPPTGHPTLKFMGPTGCVLPPHQRPICTLHVCTVNSIGLWPGHPEWNDEYFRLRGQIDDLEFKSFLAAEQK